MVKPDHAPIPLDWNGPACDCCPHTTQREVQTMPFLRRIWERCPDSECLNTVCPQCHAESPASSAPTGSQP
jgi:hypothetical protein